MSRIFILLTCWSVVSRMGFGPPINVGGASPTLQLSSVTDKLEFDGWRPFFPRDETSPNFEIRREGGPRGHGGLVIKHDNRKYLDGAWMRTFEIEGNRHYRITAYSQTTNVTNARAHMFVELLFHDGKGRLVNDKTISVKSRPFYAPVGHSDKNRWTEFSGIYRAPTAAPQATVKLHLRWEPRGQVEWGDISLVKSGPRTPRKVRLACANYRPRGGKTARDNLIQLRPHVARAAEFRTCK